MVTILKMTGFMLIAVGFFLAYKPDFIQSFPVPLSGYELIEKRVKWGFIIGLGIFLMYHHQWTPWLLTLWALLSALIVGIIIARLLGFVLDGLFAGQLLWLLIELAAMAVFGYLYWRQKNAI